LRKIVIYIQKNENGPLSHYLYKNQHKIGKRVKHKTHNYKTTIRKYRGKNFRNWFRNNKKQMGLQQRKKLCTAKESVEWILGQNICKSGIR
jgi:hypothetical protein